VQEVASQHHEIYFGDGVVGRGLLSGQVVRAEYAVSMLGPEGNNIRTFTLGDTFYAEDVLISSAIVNLTDPDSSSNGGEERETVDSIKFLAPLNFESQNRSVTTGDYRSRVLNDVVGVDAVNVWGGENNSPPEYGKVYISVKPKEGYVFSNIDKQNIKTTIREQNIASITPVIVEPEYLYPALTIQVMYDPSETSYLATNLRGLVLSTITNHSATALNKFNSYFRSSILSGLIDSTERSIKSNLMDVQLRKPFTPSLNINLDYVIGFSNPIYHPHDGHKPVLRSTLFSYLHNNSIYLDCSLDDTDGVVRVIQIRVDGSRRIITNVGTVNYSTGVVVLEDFVPFSINNGLSTISVTVKPNARDLIPSFNQIITIDPSDITITMVDDTLLTSTNRQDITDVFSVSRGLYSTDIDSGSDSGGGGGGSGSGGTY